MLNSLKHTGRDLGHEINRAWAHLADGWRDLFNRSSQALTQFHPAPGDAPPGLGTRATVPCWSLLAGEVEETRTELMVRVELPGMDKDDCQVIIEANRLQLSGEKYAERDILDSQFHLRERAYGRFLRVIPLPCRVKADLAQASFKNGVLTVRLPKDGGERGHSIPVV